MKQIIIENSGPLRSLNLELAFTSEGAPKPLILVGTNGAGKTNLLSLITDAVFEAAAVHYDNVLNAKGSGRSWFRVVGGRTTTVGTLGGFSVLQFEHEGDSIIYKEKAGTVDPVDAATRVPQNLSGIINWPTEGAIKEFPVTDETSRRIFESLTEKEVG